MKGSLKVMEAILFAAFLSAYIAGCTSGGGGGTGSDSPQGITAGPDGNLWFTESGGNKIVNIITTGTITEFTIRTGNSRPSRITAGPDGNLWFTESAGNKIGNITTTGTITEFMLP